MKNRPNGGKGYENWDWQKKRVDKRGKDGVLENFPEFEALH